MKGVALIHISSNNWWDYFRARDDSGISLVSNPSTEFADTLLSHADICNNWLVDFYIIVDENLGTKMTRALTLSGQSCWISYHL